MFKVGVIGPESTGKSTLCQYLANRYGGILIKEYARTYVEQLSRPYTREDVEIIARHQIEELEEVNKRGEGVCFFDTELIITKVWMEHVYGECPEWIKEAVHKYPMDVYLLCAPDIEWVPDPVRENPDLRSYLFEWYEREVQKLDIPYYIIKHCN